jgi:hypothetical protein
MGVPRFVIMACALLITGCASNRQSRASDPAPAPLAGNPAPIAADMAPNDPNEHGFVPIFNGHDLSGWVYGTIKGRLNKHGDGYTVKDGTIYCTVNDGGNLYTQKGYANFILRFQFKLTPNANNGIGIRAPLNGNAAYKGMEIQVLDDSGSKYTHLHPAQYQGSIYDVVPAIRGHEKPVGQWNDEQITADGRHVQVVLNGFKIVDANLDDVTDPATLKKHPGLQNKTGHIGFLGHGAEVQFRNLRIRELPSS